MAPSQTLALSLLLLLALAATSASAAEYFLNAYASPLPEGCAVATLADFQSAEFAAQYNVNGYLPTKSAIPQSTDCGIDVLTTVGGTPGRLVTGPSTYDFVVTFTPGTGPYEGCGSTPYTSNIALGSNIEAGNQLWTTITPAIQANASVGSFLSPGSVALLKCGSPAPPPGHFYLSQYNATAMPQGCRLATLSEVMGPTFAEQYNAHGYLPVWGNITTGTDCGFDISQTVGGSPGRLLYEGGFVTTYSPTGSWECSATYTPQISFGVYGIGRWAALTGNITSQFSYGSFYSPGSVAVLNCGVPDHTPAPVSRVKYGFVAYTDVPPVGCEIATLADFRSPELAEQYNVKGTLPVLENIPTTVNCGVNVVDERGGAPGTLQYNKTANQNLYYLVFNKLTGTQNCNGMAYPSELALGGTVMFPAITPALQAEAVVGLMYAPGSIALVKCTEGTHVSHKTARVVRSGPPASQRSSHHA